MLHKADFPSTQEGMVCLSYTLVIVCVLSLEVMQPSGLGSEFFKGIFNMKSADVCRN